MSRKTRPDFNVLVGAATVHDDRFLLLKRSARETFLPDIWGIPAGQINQAEDPRAACLRELREETGLRGKIIHLISYSMFQSDWAGEELTNVQLNFLVHVDESNVKLNESSHTESTWIALDNTENPLVDQFTRKIMSSALEYHKELESQGATRR